MLNYKKHGKWMGVLATAMVIGAGAVCLTNAKAGVEPVLNGMEDKQRGEGERAAEKSGGKTEGTEDMKNKGNERSTEDVGNSQKAAGKEDVENKEDAKNVDKGAAGQEIVLAQGETQGYQVQVAYLSDGEAADKEDLEMGMYEGEFAIQTYRDGDKCAEYSLQLADKMYFPADGFDLVIKDYDGDGVKNDFSLGQGQTPDPMLGNFMSYFFFAVNEDGSIRQHVLSTKDGESLCTVPDDFSKDFPCKGGTITYQALGENGTRERTVKLVRAA